MAKPPEIEQDYSDEEIAKRRDAGLRRILTTPPKPHKKPTTKKSGSRRQSDKG